MPIVSRIAHGNNVNSRVWVVIAKETVWPVKLKKFTLCPFTEKMLLIHNIIYSSYSILNCHNSVLFNSIPQSRIQSRIMNCI